MDYQEYLLSDTWQTIRATAIKRAYGRCRLCNSNQAIQVHHRKYPKQWGKEPQSDLTVLCERCHNHFHKTIQPKELPKELVKITIPRKRDRITFQNEMAWQRSIIKQRKTQIVWD